MSGSNEEVPQLLVEQLALGELDAGEAAELRERLGEDHADAALARLAASNEEILADYPPERLAADIQRRLAREQEAAARGRRRAIPWVLVPTMVAAAALVWIVVREPEPDIVARGDTAELIDDGEPEQTRIKGGVEPHVVIDRRNEAGHERLGAGEVVRQGDLLQLSYVPAGRRHGVIVSIDGAGAVTLHHPSEPDGPVELRAGKEIPLAHSYELDDAPGFERFVFVTREGQAPRVTEVLEAAEQLARDPARARAASLELPGTGWEQHDLLLRKAPSAAGDGPEGAPSPTPAEGDEEAP